MMSQEEILEFVALWQSRLNLTDWQIAVVFSDKVTVNGHECHMKVHRSAFYKRAALTVAAGSLDPSKLPDCIERDLLTTGTVTHEEYVECSIAHELLHLLLRDLMSVMEMVDEELHPSVRSLLSDAQTRTEEAIVEHLAQALVANWDK